MTPLLDFILKLAAPVDEGSTGDVQFVGDAGEAEPLGAQLDEAVLNFDVRHALKITRALLL